MTGYQFACPCCGHQADRWDPDTVFNEGTPYCSDPCRQRHYAAGLWCPGRLVDVPPILLQPVEPAEPGQLGADDRNSFAQVDDLAPLPNESDPKEVERS